MKLFRKMLSAALLILVVAHGRADAAEQQNLYIYGDLDLKISTSLLKEFKLIHPEINTDFINMGSSDVFSRHMNDVAAGRVSADILWNGEVTLQAALLKDGYALNYPPLPDPSILPGADTAQSVFAAAFEPVVMVYNKDLLPQKELPFTREVLGKKVGSEQWRGKAGTVDPEKNRTALLLLTQDLAYGRDFWGFVRKFGNGGLKVFPDYQSVLSEVENGKLLFAYNIPLSEALRACGADKNAGWYYMTDYNLAIPETALIAKKATNQVQAKLWIDFIRTEKAQMIISAGLNRYPVRKDLTTAEMVRQAGPLPEGGRLKIIGAGSEVTRIMPDGVKRGFILRWKQLLKLVK